MCVVGFSDFLTRFEEQNGVDLFVDGSLFGRTRIVAFVAFWYCSLFETRLRVWCCFPAFLLFLLIAPLGGVCELLLLLCCCVMLLFFVWNKTERFFCFFFFLLVCFVLLNTKLVQVVRCCFCCSAVNKTVVFVFADCSPLGRV